MTTREKVKELSGWPFYAVKALLEDAKRTQIPMDQPEAEGLVAMHAKALTPTQLYFIKRLLIQAQLDHEKTMASVLKGMSPRKRREWIDGKAGE